jgi:hypothetical protein
MDAGGSSCDLCAANRGEYLITRTCCALRLVRSTPRGDARKATLAHIASSLDAEAWTAFRVEAQRAGLLKAPS